MNQSPITLVTGATGFTGRHLCKRLVDEGYTVRAICRPHSERGDLMTLPIEWFRGDVFDPELVRQAMEGVQTLFHMATLYRYGGASEAEHRLVHVESTRLLAEAAALQPDFKRFVHVSTIGVHGHIEKIPADETAPFAPGDAYQQTKLEAEIWLNNFAASQEFPFTVLRPAAIYGPGDERLLKLFRMALKPVFPRIGNSRGLYHLIHVEDLVDIMLLAASRPEACGEAFICGNPESITLEDLIKTVARTFGKNPRVLRIPAAPLFALAGLCETICTPLHLPPPLYKRRVAFFTKDRSFDTRKVRSKLGWTPRYNNEEGLQATARAYREAGKL